VNRVILAFLLALASVAVAETKPVVTGVSPTEYAADEFPSWVLDLRRAEILTVGAFPFTFLFAGLSYDTVWWSTHGFPATNVPWPAGPGTSNWTTSSNPEQLKTKNLTLVATSLGLSLLIAGADYLLRQFEPVETP
jgi:hypothetical protein